MRIYTGSARYIRRRSKLYGRRGGYMLSKYVYGAAIIAGSLLALIGIYAKAQDTAQQTTTTVTTTTPTGEVTEKRVITTTAPAPKETIITPTGYAYCFIVKAGWYLDTWVAEHSVCQYPNSPEGIAWVEGYWSCNKYDLTSSRCINWEWKSAHWEKTFSAY